MNKKLLITLILLVAHSSVWSSESINWKEYKLAFPINDNVENKITFNFVGKKYTGYIQSSSTDSLEKKISKILENEQKFIADIVASNAAGDRKKILALWAVSERADIAQMMESKKAFEQNSAFFRNIQSTKLIAVNKYDAYYLFYVEHEVKGIGTYMKLYPALSEGNSYFMSNGLKGDVFYEKVATDLLPYMEKMVPVK